MATLKGKVSKNTSGDDGIKNKEEKPVKIDKWDGSALKNALDDAAKKVLSDKLSYKESHTLMDGRLVLCTISVAFALFALLWDYINPFPKSRPVLIICVLSYFVMMIVLTLYTTYKERGCVMVAHEKDKAGVDPDNVWTLSSRLKRYDDMYELYMGFTSGETGESYESSFTKSVGNFFDENGYLCDDLYEAEVTKLHADLVALVGGKKSN